MPGLYQKQFSIRWTGSIRPRYSEQYTFFTDADDGVRLWIDGKLLVNKWVDQPGTESGGTITLQANRIYSIQMEYYENGAGEAGIKLGWFSPSQEREIIPTEQLLSPPVLQLPAPGSSRSLPASPRSKSKRPVHAKTRHKK